MKWIKNSIMFGVTVLLLGTLAIPVLTSQHTNAIDLKASTGWLTGWKYRREITIDNTNNPNSLQDYQVEITMDTNTLIIDEKLRRY